MKKHFTSFLALLIVLSLSSCVGASSKYAAIDSVQSESKKYEDIAEYMDAYLEDHGYFVLRYSIEWVGYIKYKDTFSEEEFEEMETGGYYTYLADLSTGEIAVGRISTYWEDGADPEILNLNVETAASEKVIVEYNEDKFTECWKVYQEKCSSN